MRPHLLHIIAALLAVLALTSAASAQPKQPNQHFGDWWVFPMSDEPRLFVAGTPSQSGDILRTVCSIEGCVWMVTTKTGCDKDATQDVLVSTDKGAATLELVCVGKRQDGSEWYDQVFTNSDHVDQLIRSGRVIGFAVVLEGGQFKVTRYSTEGAADAATEASRRAGRGRSGRSTTAKDLKDERL
jgi:hypothetical protein